MAVAAVIKIGRGRCYVPMALSLGVGVDEVGGTPFSSFSVMVDVEGLREKVLARGPKWVSFSSAQEARHVSQLLR